MTIFMENTPQTATPTPTSEQRPRHERPVVRLDVEKYQHYLDESGFSDQEKQAFIETLWTLIVTLVDLGIGVHPVQLACGQTGNSAPEIGAESGDLVGSAMIRDNSERRAARDFGAAGESDSCK